MKMDHFRMSFTLLKSLDLFILKRKIKEPDRGELRITYFQISVVCIFKIHLYYLCVYQILWKKEKKNNTGFLCQLSFFLSQFVFKHQFFSSCLSRSYEKRFKVSHCLVKLFWWNLTWEFSGSPTLGLAVFLRCWRGSVAPHKHLRI